MRDETPQRIQRQRTKGWRMPANTVYVGRGGEFGNRYKLDSKYRIEHVDGQLVRPLTPEAAVRLYKEWLEWQIIYGYPPRFEKLRGKNLACWCPLDQPCHADVLLELANQVREEAST